MDKSKYNIVLGSKSPRRAELLRSLDLAFSIKTKATYEDFPKDLNIDKVAEYLAIKKAKAILPEILDNELLITSDTTVLIGNEIMNKPESAKEAHEMLSKLSGNKSLVITGVFIGNNKQETSFSETTTVYFDQLNPLEIDYYIKKYKPFDKAGAYGIQEWIGKIGIKKIEGCYYNVMGLPTQRIWKILNSL